MSYSQNEKIIDEGSMAARAELLRPTTPGGLLVRRLLPAAVLVPVGAGWLIWQGQRMGAYDTHFGFGLFTAANVVALALLVVATGQKLNRLYVEREGAEQRRHQLADGTPQLVWTASTERLPDIDERKRGETRIATIQEELQQRILDVTAELEHCKYELRGTNEKLLRSALQLEQSDHEWEDFARVAAHDMQEPLRKILVFGNRLKTLAREAMDMQGRDYLDRMLNATTRMQALIHDLLRFSKLTSEVNPLLTVDLSQVMQAVLSDLEVQIAETDAIVEVGNLPCIEADSRQMFQLLENLIKNALKFHRIGQSPYVRVYVQNSDGREVEDGLLRLTVEDSGIGFDEKHLDRIFTMFQRLHGPAPIHEGTGMGLAICQKIAQRHGGTITARSSPGLGSAFLVTLPLRHSTGIKSAAAEAGSARIDAPERRG